MGFDLEEAHSEELLKVRGSSAGEYAEERRVVMGASKSIAGALVMPVLKAFISEQVAREAAIMKEQRKAEEECALLAGPSLATGTTTAKGAAKR